MAYYRVPYNHPIGGSIYGYPPGEYNLDPNVITSSSNPAVYTPGFGYEWGSTLPPMMQNKYPTQVHIGPATVYQHSGYHTYPYTYDYLDYH